MRATINNKKYELVKRECFKVRSCFECAAGDDAELCDSLPNDCVTYGNGEMIWKEVEE